MQPSEKGWAFTSDHEKQVLRAYLDATGTPTIGKGITSAAGVGEIKLGMVLTEVEAEALFKKAAAKYIARVNAVFPKCTQQLMDGAFSFDYNTGAIKSATWAKRHKEGKLPEAEKSLKLWTKSKGKVLPGLVRRRNEEADIIFRGKYPSASQKASDKKSVKSAETVEAQTFLKNKGLYEAVVDGIDGPKTKAAVMAYQKFHPHLTNDGILGVATLTQMRKDAALLSSTAKSMVKEGGPLMVGVGVLSQVVDSVGPFLPLLAVGVVVAVVGWRIWVNRDVIQCRFNKLIGRETC